MVEKQRIKGFYQKPYTTFHPFGTDGQLIDMLSGLNLEEQLKIGFVPDNIQIIDGESFTVIQTYKYKDKNNNDVIYSVVSTTTQLTNNLLTELQENGIDINVITASNYKGLAIQQVSISSAQEATVVMISLYKGIYDPEGTGQKPIASKILIIPEVDI